MIPTALMFVALILLIIELVKTNGKAVQSLTFVATCCIVLSLLWEFAGWPR